MKLKRFKYLSDYYISLLEVKEELKNKWVLNISIWVENMKSFTLWKIEKADIEFKNEFPYMIDKMIGETEVELKVFINN